LTDFNLQPVTAKQVLLQDSSGDVCDHIKSGRDLETFKEKTFSCKWVMLERKLLVFISAANLIPFITGGEQAS